RDFSCISISTSACRRWRNTICPITFEPKRQASFDLPECTSWSTSPMGNHSPGSLWTPTWPLAKLGNLPASRCRLSYLITLYSKAFGLFFGKCSIHTRTMGYMHGLAIGSMLRRHYPHCSQHPSIADCSRWAYSCHFRSAKTSNDAKNYGTGAV